jgi:hypothetical protein
MSDPEEQFDDVRRLLGCKRFERPPPGYFSSFSAGVIARIERAEANPSVSWWSWLVERFDAKPVLVCAYGLAVSSLLFFGFSLSQVFEAEAAATSAFGGPWLAATPGASILFSQNSTDDASWDPSVGTGVLIRAPKQALRVEPADLLLPSNGLRVQPASYRFSSF